MPEPQPNPDDPAQPHAAGPPPFGGGSATRRTVIVAATGVLGVIGTAACTAPGATTANARSSARPSSGASTRPSSGSSTVATEPSPVTPAGTPSTGAAANLLGTSGPDLQSGPAAGARVALTFHGAGATALTATVLQIARAHDARLTVFAVGQWLAANPRLGRAILAAGHDLGNHTWSHQPMRRLSRRAADLEVSRGADAVAAVRGSAGLLFRPSGTPSSTATIRSAALASGYHRCISYDVDPSDYLDPGPAAVRDRTLTAVRAGSIISLHLGHAGTVAALPGILDGLRQRGLAAVTVTDLLTGAR